MQANRNRRKFFNPRSPFFWLIVSIGVGLFFCIWLNIQPYVGLVAMLFAETSDSPAIAFLLSLPVIGWALGNIGGFLITFTGFFVWAIFQILELLPLFLMGSRDNILQIIHGIERVSLLTVNEDDLPFVQQLKEKHNNLPIHWIQTAMTLSSIAYILDLIACCSYYPPIKGGVDRIGLFLAAPTWADIDMRNVILTVITLFAVEALVWLFLWAWNINVTFVRRGVRQ